MQAQGKWIDRCVKYLPRRGMAGAAILSLSVFSPFSASAADAWPSRPIRMVIR